MADFEDRLGELEAVVERLERGELSLEDSVKLFEKGVQLSNACKAELDRAEGRIQVLVESANGSVRTTNLDLSNAPSGGKQARQAGGAPDNAEQETLDDDIPF